MGDILFLAHRVPFPPNRGDKIRAHHLLKNLASIGAVHAGCFAESEEDRAGESELETICASHRVVNRTKPLVLAGAEAVLSGKPVSLTAFHSVKLESWVRETIASRDIATVVIFSGQMGQYVPDDFDGRVIIDLCDVDSAKFEGYANAGERVWLNAREGRLLAQEEERLCKRADTTILISENEASLFRDRLRSTADTNIAVLGNGIDSVFFDPAGIEANSAISARPGPHFVFTGQMDYRPNEQAALWVIDNFLPAIRAVHPSAEFHVVGRNPTAKLLARKDEPGLAVHGEVPDVRPYIAAADCVLAPLLIARGVQNKVLEAMAMAKPVLATPEAATGIPATDGRDWMVCQADAQAMIARLTQVIGDQTANSEMGRNAREFVLNHHSWDAMLAPLEAMVATNRPEARNAA
ncbi:TIGR03087 family PEP-CTERM/XrtA system glycosyltransferase [Erythrobacter sp. F6033]|uniref:TIGR03087 family PEP-CTERM/XrtA system glycosyltransferase n=1 Tax=Erythrobacter sp. F6033 TaxID=2926401 RepID=UPI001FF69AFA|nr:TIGR03087 family PEP-CTERM/XrtA system glycosyltransferase [Erythrobacter sp. F6033]MCK0128253.1 TIGR03087 family PEP-CTERM/XrtA system glycosyltransferase [Erythrobacter sp. F6033]